MVGSHLAYAVYSGSNNFIGSTAATIPETVNKAATTVTVSSNLTSSIFNQAVTYTANVNVVAPGAGTPTGNVIFYLDSTSGTLLGTSALSASGTASISSAAVPVNNHLIIAVYGGDGNFTGNTGQKSQTVLYASGGACDGDVGHQILQPINADGASTFKQGSTVPAKFRACDANGNSVGVAGVVSGFNLVAIISGTITNTVTEPVVSTTPDGAFRWDPSAQQWIFNISTSNLSTHSTYIYQISLNDGSNIKFQYGLPK